MKSKKINLKQSFNSVTASWDLQKLTKIFMAFGILIILVTFWVWYTRLYMTPERRFWSAINNSMATPSVVRTLEEGGSGNQVTQQFRFHFAPQRAIENKVSFNQKSATVDTTVITEGIIFPDDQYLRYTEFTNKSNEQVVSDIDELLGKWARQEATDAEDARLNFLSEYVTLVVFGNFPANVRAEIIQDMKDKNVYKVDFDNSADDVIDGEKVIRYAMAVNLRAFAEMLNDTFIRAGYGDFPPLNPENYQEGSVLNSSIAIRKRDNSIIGVNFGNREEKYSNYGVLKNIEPPTSELTIDELQDKVQSSIDI